MAEPQDHTSSAAPATEPERENSHRASAATSPTPQLERSSSPEGSEEGETADTDPAPALATDDAPPLPDEPLPEDAPPLPDEPLPGPTEEDDGWSAQLDTASGCWYFLNRFTGLSQWDNPRVPTAVPSQQYAPGTGPSSHAPGTAEVVGAPPPPPGEPYLGYNPKIHGDFDPNADYAKWHQDHQTEEWAASEAALAQSTAAFEQAGTFNRFTGAFQAADKSADNHNDENKSKRQLNAFFDVDRAANAHEGRSLKAERANQKLSKKQAKAFNEQRRAKKEQKRRDFLMS